MLWGPCSTPFTWSFYLPPGCWSLTAALCSGELSSTDRSHLICYQLLPNKSFPNEWLKSDNQHLLCIFRGSGVWGLLSYRILTLIPRDMAVRLSARIESSEGLRGMDYHFPGGLTHRAVGRRPCFLVTVTSSQDCLSFLSMLRLVSHGTGNPRKSKAESTAPFIIWLQKSPTVISTVFCRSHRPVCSVWVGTTQGHGRKIVEGHPRDWLQHHLILGGGRQTATCLTPWKHLTWLAWEERLVSSCRWWDQRYDGFMLQRSRWSLPEAETTSLPHVFLPLSLASLMTFLLRAAPPWNWLHPNSHLRHYF